MQEAKSPENINLYRQPFSFPETIFPGIPPPEKLELPRQNRMTDGNVVPKQGEEQQETVNEKDA